MLRSSSFGFAIVLSIFAIACSASTADPAPSGTPADPVPAPSASADPDPKAPAPGAMVTIDLGTVAGGKVVEFTAPKGTVGFNVVGVPVAAGDDEIGIADLVAPDGTKIVESGVPEGSTVTTSYPGIASTGVPRGPASLKMKDKSGVWKVSFDAPSPVKAKVHVQVTSDGAFHGGVLDLHVYIPVGLEVHDPGPMHLVSATTAETDEAVKARVDAYFAAAGSLFGLERGKVTFHEIDASFLTVDEKNMAKAVSQSAVVGDGQAMHLVWTSKLSLFKNETWGVSPGAPGGGVSVGHPGAAVVVELTSTYPAKADGLTMLHETGHFFGLQHTTELSGGYSDPLDDTAICKDISTENVRQCADKSNLMFPVFYGTTGGKNVVLSEDQRAVIHGSPIYRAK